MIASKVMIGGTEWNVHDTFSVFVPAEVAKGRKNRTIIRGYASTDLPADYQGERVLQDGLDWSYWKDHGWFNDDHDKTTAGGVGLPLDVKPDVEYENPKTGRKGRAAYVEGYLLATQKGEEIADLAMRAQEAGRQLGFSIQGPIVSRTGEDGKTIAKALVMDVAVTRHPVNPEATFEVVAKSLLSVMSKSVDAGNTSVTYSGGGSGGATLPQSLNQGLVKIYKGGSEMKDEKDLASAFGSLAPEKQKEALKAVGAWEEEKAEEKKEEDKDKDKDTKMEKAEDVKPEEKKEEGETKAEEKKEEEALKSLSLREAFRQADEHVAKGGVVEINLLSKGEKAAEKLTPAPTLDLSKSFGDLSKSLTDKIGEVVNPLAARLEEIEKSLKIPVHRKSVQPGDVMVKSMDNGGSGPQPLTRAVMAKSLLTAFNAATNQGERNRIGALMTAADAGEKFTRDRLTAEGVKVIE
jgi:hypothetical protein